MVVISSAQKRCSGRRAQCSRVEVVIPQPAVGNAFEVWHVNWTTKGAWLTEAHVVNQNNEHIGSVSRRFYLEARWRRGLTRIENSAVWIPGFGNRQGGPVERLLSSILRQAGNHGRHCARY